MGHSIACHRCGASLAALSLPLSRRDQCPACYADLHVCRQCLHFDPAVPRQCREDDADDVTDKHAVNFCDYFAPSDNAFDPAARAVADAAQAELNRLFGASESEPADKPGSPADKLFE